MSTRRSLVLGITACLLFGLTAWAVPAVAKQARFVDSDDAEEPDEPQTYLPDYTKLVEGQDADWVYFPEGALRSRHKVQIGELTTNARPKHELEARHGLDYATEFLEEWLKKQGFELVESGGDMVIELNLFNAWEPSGGARFWGGWMANPGCGIEIILKDPGGKVLGYVRHKARGSTIPDAIENGLEEMIKAVAKGR